MRTRDDDDRLEPADHSGDPAAEGWAVDLDHLADPDYRELDLFPERRWQGKRRWLTKPG